MAFYWNIMMYECEVEHKRVFFVCVCFSIFNEHYFTSTNSFRALLFSFTCPLPLTPSLMLNLAAIVVKNLSAFFSLKMAFAKV